MTNPDDSVIFTVPYPIALQDALRICRLVRSLGFADHRTETRDVNGERILCVRRWTLDVAHSAARAAATGDASPADVYAAVRRALRACVDTEFRKAFWSARLLGGYEAAGAYLLANAPKRRANRSAKDVREILDAAWRLHDPEVDQRIFNQLNAILPGGSAKIAGLTVRRGAVSGNEWSWWIASPYLGRVYGLPGEPRRLIRPIFEAEVLAGANLERPRCTRKR